MLENNIKYISIIQPDLAKELEKVEAKGEFHVDNRTIPPTSIVVFLGAGVFPKLPKQCIHVVVIEPNIYQLKYWLENVGDLPALLGGRELLIVNTSDLNQINRFFYSFFRSEVRLGVLDAHHFYMRQGLIGEEYNFFNHVKNTFISAASQAVTSFSGSKIHFQMGLKHFVGNAIKKHIDYRSLKNIAKDIPAVVCSGGPSLEKDFEALRQFPGIIISLDAPYAGLLEEGIKPDFVSIMDREPKLIKFFEKYDSDNYLVAIPEVSDEVTSLFEPNIVMLPTLRRFYVKGLGFDDAFDGGTATTHLSFAWARYLGCNPIILCGQDFCIPKENTREHQYSRFVKHTEFSKRNFEQMKTETVGRRGEKVLTSVAFMEMKSVFEDMLADKKGNSKVLNSSWGLDIIGAKGTELADFIKDCGEVKKINISPTYRQKDIVNKNLVESSLKRYWYEIRDSIRKNNMKKYQKVMLKLAKEPLFNDIVFVMMSNDYLEYLNIKNMKVNIGGMSEKRFTSQAKIFMQKILKNITDLRNVLE